MNKIENLTKTIIRLTTHIVGGASLIGFTAFLFWGPFHLVDIGLSAPYVIGINTLLSLLFFIQHTIMVKN